MAVSYLEFLLIFIVTPIILLTLSLLYRNTAWKDRDAFFGLVIIIFLAFVYTTPWDNWMIEAGVWWYGEDATLIHFWKAPLGEYMFFVLQPILTAFFLFNITRVKDLSLHIDRKNRFKGVLAGLLVMLLGLTGLMNQSTFYLGSILFWSGPILAIQWGFGWLYLLKNWKIVLTSVMAPTLYLWIADAWAIHHGLWTISETHTVGISFGSLPLEEAVFFLVTNIFIVQGLIMYQWVAKRKGVRKYFDELLEDILER